MSINDPILEMLSFAIEKDLNLVSGSSMTPQQPGPSSAMAPSSSSQGASKLGAWLSPEDTEETDGLRLTPLRVNPATKGAIRTALAAEKNFVRSNVILGEGEEIPCLIPSCPFKICGSIHQDKKLEGDLLAHLLTEHKVVVEKPEEISNWFKYLDHWRGKLDKAVLISEFCVGFIMEDAPVPAKPRRRRSKQRDSKTAGNDGDKSGAGASSVSVEAEKDVVSPTRAGKEDKTGAGAPDEAVNDVSDVEPTSEAHKLYYMLSPVVPEDSKLRKQLWKERLDIVLEVNRQERMDDSFARRCLFCRDILTGNRTEYFSHMKESHSFHLGHPDNLVFVRELIQLIDDKMKSLKCLFCENTFRDRVILKEHMRKKQHRQLNPQNKEYDRYYVVNYLEPGKTWETIQHEDWEDERQEEEWIEPADERERNIVCLLCRFTNSDFPTVLEHMKTEHSFDFLAGTADFDFYQRVKLVNFIRRTVYQNTCPCCEERFVEHEELVRHMHSDHVALDFEDVLQRQQWDEPEYFFSTYEDDDFLTCLDCEDNEMGGAGDASNADDDNRIIPEDSCLHYVSVPDFDLPKFVEENHRLNHTLFNAYMNP